MKVKQKACYLTSRGFNFFIYKMGMIIAPPTENVKIKWDENLNVPSTEQVSVIPQPLIMAWTEVPREDPCVEDLFPK